MKEKFEEIIKNKIDHFITTNKVSYKPEHWQMLLDKKKKTKKRAIAYWRWVAVIVFFILAGGVTKMLYNAKTPLLIPKQKIIIKSKNDTLQEKNLEQEKIQVTVAKEKEESNIKNAKTNNAIKSIKRNKKNTLIAALKEPKTKNEILVAEKDKSNKTTILPKKNTNKNKIETKETPILIAEKTNKKTDLKAEIKEIETLHTTEKKRLITLGINASPMLNYTSSTGNTGVGYSGGISVEIPISNKFDVQAELVYANHKMDYLNHRKPKLLYTSNSPEYTNESVSPKVNLSSKEATISMIEIPISLKYNFKIQEQKLFLSAGISSTSVLKEKINSTYNVSSRVVENSLNSNTTTYRYVTDEKIISTEKTTNYFNLIGAFQVSFGGEFKIDKNQSIVVEPYYKHFVRPVTTQKTTFSNVGIRLQYRFNFKK